MASRQLSRRQVFIASLLAGGAALVSGAFGKTIERSIPWIAGTSPEPRGFDGARFLTNEERRCLDALVSRLIPQDELGPGALEAGAVDFIDNQLAGHYGRGERWYMQGPFAKALETQGYQSELAPAGLYRAAIAALDEHCRRSFQGRVFADLSPEEQDELLRQMEAGDLDLEDVPVAAFFGLLMENTVEGFFCDPIYGGNRDMAGWRLVGFPGARYDYRDYLDHNGERISIEPVGLRGRPAWNVE